MKNEWITKLKNFPVPDCVFGYSWTYLEEIMDEETFKSFSHWMRGQTCSICDGRNYNHEKKEYEPSSCAASPHGGIAYSWDVRRFLGLEGPVAKEIWD